MVSASAFADFQALQHKALQQAIDIGMADIKAGRVVDGEEAIAGLRKQVIDVRL
jgi:predicted transcriptional regulator